MTIHHPFIYGNWIADTVFIDGGIHVPNNQSLTIQEGVTVYFTGSYDFDVYGDLTINGTREDSVKITSYVDGPGPSSWTGLRIYDHDHNRAQVTNINFTIIENGQKNDVIRKDISSNQIATIIMGLTKFDLFSGCYRKKKHLKIMYVCV